ncbi:hypothetical protein BDF21DRAFT_415499 [Thamnidium elegans]|nr:hypothetical protein BDF21DRAFT_415499 [Thamnidium elegans]
MVRKFITHFTKKIKYYSFIDGEDSCYMFYLYVQQKKRGEGGVMYFIRSLNFVYCT